MLQSLDKKPSKLNFPKLNRAVSLVCASVGWLTAAACLEGYCRRQVWAQCQVWACFNNRIIFGGDAAKVWVNLLLLLCFHRSVYTGLETRKVCAVVWNNSYFYLMTISRGSNYSVSVKSEQLYWNVAPFASLTCEYSNHLVPDGFPSLVKCFSKPIDHI